MDMRISRSAWAVPDSTALGAADGLQRRQQLQQGDLAAALQVLAGLRPRRSSVEQDGPRAATLAAARVAMPPAGIGSLVNLFA